MAQSRKILTSAQEAVLPSKASALQYQLQCQRVVLGNGLVLLVTENPVADIVAARFFIDAGSGRERREQAGLSHLVASVLTKGTQSATAKAIAAEVESTGANLGVESTPDYFLLSLKTVTSDFAAMLKLAAQILQTPTFPEAELALEQKLTLQAIRARQEQPMAIALQQLRLAMYPDHPYGQPSLGSSESVTSLAQADLGRFHAQYFRPENTILSIAGNLALEDALALVTEHFLPWRPALLPPQAQPSAPSQSQFPSQPSTSSTPSAIAPSPTCTDTVQDNQQSIVMLGYPTASVRDADHAALKVLFTYLCGGLSSRLFTELREKRGLAYEVSGLYPTRRDPSHFLVYLGTAAENTAIAQTLLQAEMQRLAAQPLSDPELSAAKTKLLGQYALGKQTNHQIAHAFGWYEALGLGIDYERRFPELIQAVTAEQAHQAAQRYFGQPFISRVGPEAALRLSQTYPQT